MAKTGSLRYLTSAAGMSSWVLRGFEAQSRTSAPPILRASIRLAVSDVTWRQAAMRTPARGLFLAKVFLMLSRTGMERAAHSIRRRPLAAKLMSLISWSMVFSPYRPDVQALFPAQNSTFQRGFQQRRFYAIVKPCLAPRLQRQA